MPGFLEIENIAGGTDFTYQWYLDGSSDLLPNSNSDTYSATMDGNYTLVATNEYGCEIQSNSIFI